MLSSVIAQSTLPAAVERAKNPLARLARQSMARLDQLTPTQREGVMYWVGGLAPLATNATTPFFTRLRFEKAGLPSEEVRKNVLQETARQLVSAGTHGVTYFGTSLLIGAGARKAANKNLLMFLAGTAASYVGYAVIRPLVSAEIILRWLYPNTVKPAEPKTPLKKPPEKLPATHLQAVFAGFA